LTNIKYIIIYILYKMSASQASLVSSSSDKVLPPNVVTYSGYNPANYMSKAVGGKSKRSKSKSNKKCRTCRKRQTMKRRLNKLFVNIPYKFAMK